MVYEYVKLAINAILRGPKTYLIKFILSNTLIFMIYRFEQWVPVVHPSAFIHPLATVTGRVVIGKDVYVGPGAAIRGDWGGIEIMDGCNVQENCTIHMFPGIRVILERSAHIGHGAIIHGARIGENCLIGMNAVIMDEAEIGKESIVGALSLVKAGEKIPPRSLVAGNPAKIIREVSDEMINWKSEGTKLYQGLPARCKEDLRPTIPLDTIPEDYWSKTQEENYQTWDRQKG